MESVQSDAGIFPGHNLSVPRTFTYLICVLNRDAHGTSVLSVYTLSKKLAGKNVSETTYFVSSGT